ncbi:MAG: RHS repeat-associated core domain-containing protein [Candidatus Ozemobacteraceae bacterium]
MKFKHHNWLLGFFILLLLIPSWVSAYFSENSRQGFSAISAEMPSASSLGNTEQHKVLSRVLLKLMADSLFISKDPIGFNADSNLYRYCSNNPLSYTDPFGLFSLADPGMVAGNKVWQKVYGRVRALVQSHLKNPVFSKAGWSCESEITQDFKYDANSKPTIVFGTGIGMNNGIHMADTIKIDVKLLDKSRYQIIRNSKIYPITEDELAMILSNTVLHEMSHWKAGEATYSTKVQGDEFVNALNDNYLLKLLNFEKTDYYEIREETSITRW